MLTWDEPKRRSNIKDHSFDFIGGDAVFDGPVIT